MTDERPPQRQHLPSLPAVVSLLLVAVAIALLGSHPQVLGDGADWPTRIALAFLLVGGFPACSTVSAGNRATAFCGN